MKFGISEKSFKLILKTLNEHPEIEKAIIFGSRAIGNYKTGSDIDLALYGENLTRTIVDEVNSELNERLPIPYFIDVINYAEIKNKDLKEHIDSVGKVVLGK